MGGGDMGGGGITTAGRFHNHDANTQREEIKYYVEDGQ
jgi:hypothetical protein